MAYSIGEQLKQAREKRGLTLEQVAQATHIRVYYLEALENDRRDALPSAVQGRGFLRLYAGQLGLPAGPLLAAWEGKQPVYEQGAGTNQAAPEVLPASEEPPGPTAPPDPGDHEDPAPALEIPSRDERLIIDSAAVEEAGSQLIFKEIGNTLRKQRETLGLSMAEVERFTRLRQHYIQALEDGDMHNLPSPVQGRGMLSNYAGFLNLDEEALLLRFAEGLQARRIERLHASAPTGLFSTKKRPVRRAPIWKRFLTPDLIFGVGIAAIILFFALWTVSRINSLRQAETEPTVPAIAEVLRTAPGRENTTETPPVSGAPVEVGATDGAPGAGTTSVAGASIEGDPTEGGVPTLALENPVGDATGTEIATLPPINNDPLQIYVIAHHRAWMRVVTDGKVAFLGRVVPGNAYAFSGSKQVELATGNGAALQVYYNQVDLGIIGEMGGAVALVFTPDEGIMTPTPAFTATPTATPPATITPMPSATLRATPTITPFIPGTTKTP